MRLGTIGAKAHFEIINFIWRSDMLKQAAALIPILMLSYDAYSADLSCTDDSEAENSAAIRETELGFEASFKGHTLPEGKPLVFKPVTGATLTFPEYGSMLGLHVQFDKAECSTAGGATVCEKAPASFNKEVWVAHSIDSLSIVEGTVAPAEILTPIIADSIRVEWRSDRASLTLKGVFGQLESVEYKAGVACLRHNTPRASFPTELQKYLKEVKAFGG
jgi:hypothetical protein